MRLRDGSLLTFLFITFQASAYAYALPADLLSDERRFYDAETVTLKGAEYIEDLQPITAPTPLLWPSSRRELAEGYADAYRILRDQNSCSAFFGGPDVAIEVLNDMSQQIRKKRLSSNRIGIQQSGGYSTVTNLRSGASFRLFNSVLVNTSGPFFNGIGGADSKSGSIGRFPARSREARALMFLHEIAHLLRGADGKWLIPDDGDSLDLSAENSRTIERHCIDQLLAIKTQIKRPKQDQVARQNQT